MKIAILMATYNSSDAIHIQISSLQQQSYKDWDLFIHDDGSKDCTIDIIQSIAETDPRIHILNDDKKGRGACGSFMWLLEHVDSDYYMFCDHDDLWLPFKIELSINKLLSIESKVSKVTPICVHTDLAIADSKYNVTAPSLRKIEKASLKYCEQLKYMLVVPCVTGCTMIFNKAAKECAFPIVEGIQMHDWWIACKILANGGIVDHLTESTILYRQSGHNVVGAVAFSVKQKIANIAYVIRRGNLQKKFNIEHFGAVAECYWITKLKYVLIRLLKI